MTIRSSLSGGLNIPSTTFSRLKRTFIYELSLAILQAGLSIRICRSLFLSFK